MKTSLLTKSLFALIGAALLLASPCAAQPAKLKSDSGYLFTSFRDSDQKFLRFLWSEGGYHWSNFPGTFLEANVGEARQLRDPSIARGPDGVFHLVWTAGWHDGKGFGYASSKDLIHWSKKEFIPVMANE